LAEVIDIEQRKQMKRLKERAKGLIDEGKRDEVGAVLDQIEQLAADSDEARRADREKVVAEAKRLLDDRDLFGAIECLQAYSTKAAKALHPLSIADVFAPLGPIPWVVEALSLAPGAPGMIAGYGGRGKSWFAQALAVSVATGTPFGGLLPVQQGRVVYLDYEQASREARSRFQRIARAQDLGPSDFEDRLAPFITPLLRLSDPGVETALVKLCDHATLCVIDSLSACVSGVDENSSAMREPLDMLTRVSERTGCAFLVLHHTRKPPVDKVKEYDKEMSVRGSSGIHAACSTIWQFDGKPGSTNDGGTFVQHVKSRSSKLRETLCLVVRESRGLDPEDPARGGMEVVLAPLHADSSSTEDPATLRRAEEAERIRAAILRELAENPHGLGTHALREQVRGNKDRLMGQLELLVAKGLVEVVAGLKGARIHQLTAEGRLVAEREVESRKGHD
jgi:hypothetical protein